MIAFFSGVVAVAKAIPTLDGWLQRFIAWYVDSQIEKMKKENIAAIKRAIAQQDQRDLERALGNQNAGEVSGIPDTAIVDSLPGVHN